MSKVTETPKPTTDVKPAKAEDSDSQPAAEDIDQHKRTVELGAVLVATTTSLGFLLTLFYLQSSTITEFNFAEFVSPVTDTFSILHGMLIAAALSLLTYRVTQLQPGPFQLRNISAYTAAFAVVPVAFFVLTLTDSNMPTRVAPNTGPGSGKTQPSYSDTDFLKGVVPEDLIRSAWATLARKKYLSVAKNPESIESIHTVFFQPPGDTSFYKLQKITGAREARIESSGSMSSAAPSTWAGSLDPEGKGLQPVRWAKTVTESTAKPIWVLAKYEGQPLFCIDQTDFFVVEISDFNNVADLHLTVAVPASYLSTDGVYFSLQNTPVPRLKEERGSYANDRQDEALTWLKPDTINSVMSACEGDCISSMGEPLKWLGAQNQHPVSSVSWQTIKLADVTQDTFVVMSGDGFPDHDTDDFGCKPESTATTVEVATDAK